MEPEGTSSQKDLCSPSHYKQKCFCSGGFLVFSVPLLTCLS